MAYSHSYSGSSFFPEGIPGLGDGQASKLGKRIPDNTWNTGRFQGFPVTRSQCGGDAGNNDTGKSGKSLLGHAKKLA